LAVSSTGSSVTLSRPFVTYAPCEAAVADWSDARWPGLGRCPGPRSGPASDAEALAGSQVTAAPKPVTPSAQAATPKSVERSARAAMPKSTERDAPAQIRKRGADWLAQCVKDWDVDTHMSKKDWQRVCRRVATERTNELM
jgi:hypothetical protein